MRYGNPSYACKLFIISHLRGRCRVRCGSHASHMENRTFLLWVARYVTCRSFARARHEVALTVVVDPLPPARWRVGACLDSSFGIACAVVELLGEPIAGRARQPRASLRCSSACGQSCLSLLICDNPSHDSSSLCAPSRTRAIPFGDAPARRARTAVIQVATASGVSRESRFGGVNTRRRRRPQALSSYSRSRCQDRIPKTRYVTPPPGGN